MIYKSNNNSYHDVQKWFFFDVFSEKDPHLNAVELCSANVPLRKDIWQPIKDIGLLQKRGENWRQIKFGDSKGSRKIR